jgi:hypothetical protein
VEGSSSQGMNQNITAGSSKGPQQQRANLIMYSAPPKLVGSGTNYASADETNQNSKIKSNISTSKEIIVEDLNENGVEVKVLIPETCEESEESDTLSEKMRIIDAYNEEVHGGSQVNENTLDQHIWFMEESARAIATSQDINLAIQLQKKVDMDTEIPMTMVSEKDRCEKEGGEGDVINSQESVITEAGQTGVLSGAADENQEKMVGIDSEGANLTKIQKAGQDLIVQEEPRRSDRLKNVIHLTTLERNEAMAKKRNLEGNTKKPQNIVHNKSSMLHDIAKDMGVLVNNADFASFDLMKDLGVAKNCLFKKQLKQFGKNNKVKIDEFVLSEDQVTIHVSSHEGSDF